MKKFLAILLATLLSLSVSLVFGTVALADGETGSITVENAKPGATYTAYKIFDVEYITVVDAEGNPVKAYLYTIETTSPWYDLVSAYATEANGITLVDYLGVKKIDVDNDVFSASDLAAYLKVSAIPEGATAIPMANADGEATVDGLDFGYYFVTSSVGVIAALTTTDPNATIIEKNPFDFDKAEDNDNFDMGDSVNYTVVATIPGTTAITDYVFKFTDVMTAGLTYNDDVTVEVIDADENVIATLVEDTHYDVTLDGERKFVLNLYVMNADVQALAGEVVRLTYSATVNENAVKVISVNTVTLEYGHADDLRGTSDDVVLYSNEVVINKYEKGDETKKLAGAEFVLYKMDGEDKKYYALNAGVVSWVDDIDDATVVITDDDGKAVFAGVADGTYNVEETKAPTGYAKLDGSIEAVLNGIADINNQTNTTAIENTYANGGVNFTVDLNDLTVTVDVENATGSIILPATGGIGTTIFYILGTILLLGAAVILFARKRAVKAEDNE